MWVDRQGPNAMPGRKHIGPADLEVIREILGGLVKDPLDLILRRLGAHAGGRGRVGGAHDGVVEPGEEEEEATITGGEERGGGELVLGGVEYMQAGITHLVLMSTRPMSRGQ